MKLNRAPDIIWQDPLQFIAFGFGVGAMPIAPGTFGTLAAMPFYVLLSGLSLKIYIPLVIILFALASWLCHRCERALRVHDHKGMVIDEYIGYFITMIGVTPTMTHLWLGFLLFRIFDIAKPWPISWLDENISGGFGVMLDDAAAGIIACVILHLF
jgi:phosphatidylglycerophosphatase A